MSSTELIVIGILGYGIIIGLYVLRCIAFMKLAKLAGRSSIAWMAWIPFINIIQQLMLSKKSVWTILFSLIPIVNLVFLFIWQVSLLRAFNKHGAYVLLELVPIIPVYTLMWIMWGFSKNTVYTLNSTTRMTFEFNYEM